MAILPRITHALLSGSRLQRPVFAHGVSLARFVSPQGTRAARACVAVFFARCCLWSVSTGEKAGHQAIPFPLWVDELLYPWFYYHARRKDFSREHFSRTSVRG